MDGQALAGGGLGQGPLSFQDQQRSKGNIIADILEAALHGIHRKVIALCQMAVEVVSNRRLAFGHIQSLRDVELAGLAVCTLAAIIVNAVGDVGILLNLSHHDALADGVERAGGDE